MGRLQSGPLTTTPCDCPRLGPAPQLFLPCPLLDLRRGWEKTTREEHNASAAMESAAPRPSRGMCPGLNQEQVGAARAQPELAALRCWTFSAGARRGSWGLRVHTCTVCVPRQAPSYRFVGTARLAAQRFCTCGMTPRRLRTARGVRLDQKVQNSLTPARPLRRCSALQAAFLEQLADKADRIERSGLLKTAEMLKRRAQELCTCLSCWPVAAAEEEAAAGSWQLFR